MSFFLLEENSKSEDVMQDSDDYMDQDDVNETNMGGCKRLDFVVNFKDIGWEKWIIYPRTYNAFYCSGSCASPLETNEDNTLVTTDSPIIDAQVTNHAQLMSIIEHKENRRIKMTNCVPTKFNSLRVIYINQEGEIDIKDYENMIVKQCGCR